MNWGVGVVSATIELLGQYYRHPGNAYGPGMAIAHAMRCSKRLVYDDAPRMRARRNVILYGPRGSCKSSLSKYFLFDIIGGVSLFDPAKTEVIAARSAPIIVTMSSGSGFERNRGTFTENGRIQAPLIQEADWIYAPELLTVLGHHPNDRSKRIEDFNDISEEGKIIVALAKGGNMELEDRLKMAEEVAEQGGGYHYDPIRAVMSYDCRAAFLGCSRFLTDKLLEELEGSGYWSRHSIEEWDPVDSVALAYANKKFGPPPSIEELAWIQGKWLDLWNTPIGTLNKPPQDLLDKLVQWFNQQLIDIKEETEVRFSQLFSSRDDTDLAQLMTASALNRVSMNRAPGDRTPIPCLEYTVEDMEMAKKWASSSLAHRRNLHDPKTTPKETEESDKAFSMLQGFMRKHTEDPHGDLDRFHSKELVDYFVTGGGGASTARRHLRALRKRGVIRPSRHSPGVYVVDDSALNQMGIEVPEPEPDNSREEEHYESLRLEELVNQGSEDGDEELVNPT